MTEKILSAGLLTALPGVRHAFFTKMWGNAGFSSTSPTQEVQEARKRMADYLGISPLHLLTCHQVHSNRVYIVTSPLPKEAPQADALITRRARVALGILSADCVPLLFVDPENHVIGVAHAGWRGALNGIIDNTIKAMIDQGAKRVHLKAAIGPCIWQKSYEVGPEFLEAFLTENKTNDQFFCASSNQNHYLFDLPGFVMKKLKDFGIENAVSSVADTYSDPDHFFSHRYSTLRGEKRHGNMLSVLMLEKPQ